MAFASALTPWSRRSTQIDRSGALRWGMFSILGISVASWIVFFALADSFGVRMALLITGIVWIAHLFASLASVLATSAKAIADHGDSTVRKWSVAAVAFVVETIYYASAVATLFFSYPFSAFFFVAFALLALPALFAVLANLAFRARIEGTLTIVGFALAAVATFLGK